MNDEIHVINKISITPEAQFDYEVMFYSSLPFGDMKPSIEKYLDCMQAHKYFNNNSYFRCVWYDSLQNKDLMLFFDGGRSFKNMQVWFLVGICNANDWSDKLESCGAIRNWLMTKIENFE